MRPRFLPGVLVLAVLGSCQSGLPPLEEPSGLAPGPTPQVLDSNPVVGVAPSGFAPQVSHITANAIVTFVNRDGVAHRISGAPELGFGDCPEATAIGSLAPGESRTTAVSRFGVCAFHEDARAGERPFQGLLVVH